MFILILHIGKSLVHFHLNRKLEMAVCVAFSNVGPDSGKTPSHQIVSIKNKLRFSNYFILNSYKLKICIYGTMKLDVSSTYGKRIFDF